MAGSEVGSAMWGGRAWPGRVTVDSADAPARELPPGLGAAIVSLILVILGAVALAVGAGLLWGLGAAIMVAGGVALAVGLLLGLTS